MRKRYKKKSIRTGKYKSKLEALVAKMLGRKGRYETETLSYLQPKKYTPDFVITKADKKVYVEVKGWFRYEDQAKMRAVKLTHPELDIRMFFPNDNRVQSSKMTNSQWCLKWNFPFAIGTIPKEWLT